MNVALPGFDGFQLCRRLRESGRWVPVLMLTARDAAGDRVRGLDAGADDYLVKPFSLLELAARLRALARRDVRSRPVILAEGGRRLDPAAKRAWRAGTEFRLSPREFSLLELFLRHPGQVLTRSQIIEAVWDWARAHGVAAAAIRAGPARGADPGAERRDARAPRAHRPLRRGLVPLRRHAGRTRIDAARGYVRLP